MTAHGGRPTRRAGLGIAVALGSALLVVGCGQAVVTNPPSAPSTTAPAASFETIAACVLVPDMDTLVGKTALTTPAEFSVGPLTRCTWVYGANPSRHVGLNVGPQFAHSDSITSFGAGEIVPGLGDDARWWPANRTLSVEVGERSFQVNLELEPAAVTKDLAIAIARSALAHMS